MATFECKVYELTIEDHPNADRLELAVVGDYRSIVMKGQFKTGDLGVYIPEAAIVPDWMIKEMGLEGRLAGKAQNRVKAVKLRKVLSQGLVYPVETNRRALGGMPAGRIWKNGNTHIANQQWVNCGDDVTEFLGITKWEPPIPVHMSGEVFNAFGMTLKYDIENIKRFPDVIEEGEFVSMTEKIHGTWCCFGFYPEFDESYIVTSKGLSDKGLAFKFNENNEGNLYIRALNATQDSSGSNVMDRLLKLRGTESPIYILGEVYGVGVQDLHYGTTKPSFRVFDIYTGEPSRGEYVSAHLLPGLCTMLDVEMVPELYVGQYSKEKMLEFTTGKETVSGESSNLREGIVIKPVNERRETELGRVALKSVSEAYLLRKQGTEFN